jgi:hypothetical protein
MRVELFPPDSDTEPRHWVRHDQAFTHCIEPVAEGVMERMPAEPWRSNFWGQRRKMTAKHNAGLIWLLTTDFGDVVVDL